MRVSAPLAIVFDTTPLGLLSQKKGIPEADACREWAAELDQVGCVFFVPEVADCELRREFIRQGNAGEIRRLDFFNASVTGEYLSLTTPAAFGLAAVVAATANAGHLSALTHAILWDELRP